MKDDLNLSRIFSFTLFFQLHTLIIRMKRAFLETYKLAIDYFDNIPVAAACICFVDLLDMDSYSMRVDIESANFILLNLKKTGNDLFESEEKLKTFLGKSYFAIFIYIFDLIWWFLTSTGDLPCSWKF